MLTIYGVYRSRATRNIWLANELGLPFRHVPVIQSYRLADPHAADAQINTASPAFLAVNPAGQIPSMDDDGFVLHESLGINLYLAKKHGGPLAPATLQEEAQMLQWVLWVVSGVEKPAVDVLYNRVAKPEAERDAALAAASVEALKRPFATLDAHLAKAGGFIVGNRFTVVDINLAECFRYAQAAPELFATVPHVKAWIEACQARPAFKDMMAKRNAEPA